MGKERHFYVTGYVGEGASRMLMDLQDMESVELIEKLIDNRAMRFLYFRLKRAAGRLAFWPLLKNFFYPWFSILRVPFHNDMENCILFFNSGFLMELDMKVLKKLKKKNNGLKFILYIVDPEVQFCVSKYKEIIGCMDLVYAINKEDCGRFGYRYYPLVFSKTDEDTGMGAVTQKGEETDIYYLGSGGDRTEVLKEIYNKCHGEGVKTDFYVHNNGTRQESDGIVFQDVPVPYWENIRRITRTNCILELMHREFDNPTQRYSEAVAYNKKILTNNKKITAFDFYDPRYMQVFQSPEEIDMAFIKNREEVNYGYQGEFSPKLLVREISQALDGKNG